MTRLLFSEKQQRQITNLYNFKPFHTRLKLLKRSANSCKASKLPNFDSHENNTNVGKENFPFFAFFFPEPKCGAIVSHQKTSGVPKLKQKTSGNLKVDKGSWGGEGRGIQGNSKTTKRNVLMIRHRKRSRIQWTFISKLVIYGWSPLDEGMSFRNLLRRFQNMVGRRQ